MFAPPRPVWPPHGRASSRAPLTTGPNGSICSTMAPWRSILQPFRHTRTPQVQHGDQPGKLAVRTYLVLGARYQVLGYHVPGTWHRGTIYMQRGTGYRVTYTGVCIEFSVYTKISTASSIYKCTCYCNTKFTIRIYVMTSAYRRD